MERYPHWCNEGVFIIKKLLPMKIKKIQENFLTLIQKVKEGKKEDILKELEETATLVNEEAAEQEAASITTETPEVTQEVIEKILGSEKAEEVVKKYVDTYISASSVAELKKELLEFVTAEVTKATGEIKTQVEKLEKTSPGSQQTDPVTKTDEKLWDW